MKIFPCNDRVVVLPKGADEKTPGGLIIPAKAQELSREGVIVAVGPGRIEQGRLIEPRLRVGDKVLMHKHKGLEVEHEGQKCLIMAESDIMAVYE